MKEQLNVQMISLVSLQLDVNMEKQKIFLISFMVPAYNIGNIYFLFDNCSFLYLAYVYIDKEDRHIADVTGKYKRTRRLLRRQES